MNIFGCNLCKFNNPKGTATAIIIKDNKVLCLVRNEDPFKGCLDFPGGYMNSWETPIETVIREVQEELGINPYGTTYMQAVPGTAEYKGKSFAILSHFFLVDIGNQEIKLNKENSLAVWVPIKEVGNKAIAFDSNVSMAVHLEKKFSFDLSRVKELVKQLDASAKFDEQRLYKAILDGHIAQVHADGTLVGMGWIFPRNTMLRNQAVVEDMIVDNAYRGKGYGEVILDELLKWADLEGMEMVELTTNPKRIAAHGLYEKRGFKLHPTDHMLLKLHD